MAQQLPHVIPSIYLANYLNDFEPLFPRYGVTLRKFSKGDILTQQGVIHNTAYFIKSGILQLSLGHDQGEKALNLIGPGTVLPVGVEFHTSYMEYAMILQAFSDGEAYAMPYPTLKRIAVENGAFAGELLRENCDFIGYLFFDTLNQTFEPCLSRVCDILYLYLTKVQPKEPVIPLSQGGAGQDCRSLPGADGAVRANLKKGRSAGHLPKAAGYLGREKIAGPLHAGLAGKFVKKRGAFPLVRESAFPWCGMLGTKKSPQGVTTHESL